MYDLGILGGMGSEATEVLFHKILGYTETQKDQDFPNMVILNKSSIPDRSAYLLGKSTENPREPLQDGVRDLNKLSVGRIAVSCNTAHAFYNDMQAVSDCPVINMLESSLSYINQTAPGARVCILGTLGTVQTKVYETYNHFPLEIMYPSEELCQEVHALIYDIKTTAHADEEVFVGRLKEVMRQVTECKDSASDCNADNNIVFLLACTELSVLGTDNFPEYNVLDALDILALVSVAAGPKRLRTDIPYDRQVIGKIARKYDRKAVSNNQ